MPVISYCPAHWPFQFPKQILICAKVHRPYTEPDMSVSAEKICNTLACVPNHESQWKILLDMNRTKIYDRFLPNCS